MADVAGGVIGLESFALQLAHLVKKLHTVAARNKDCPAELQEVLEQLESVRQWLDNTNTAALALTDPDSTLPPADVNTVARTCEQLCSKAVEDLVAVVKEIETGMGTKKRRSALKLAWNFKKLERLRGQLTSSTINLYCAYSIFYPEAMKPSAEARESSSAIISVKAVRFAPGTKADLRALLPIEAWSLYHYETHARQCDTCYNTLDTTSGRLCGTGRSLARDVAEHVYRLDGKVYSRKKENHNIVQVALPQGYTQLPQLLKSLERARRATYMPFSGRRGSGAWSEMERLERRSALATGVVVEVSSDDCEVTETTMVGSESQEHETDEYRTTSCPDPLTQTRKNGHSYAESPLRVDQDEIRDWMTDKAPMAESRPRHESNNDSTVPITIEQEGATSNAEQPECDQDDVLSIRRDVQNIGVSISTNKRRELLVLFATELLDNLSSEDVTEDLLSAMPDILLDFSKILDHEAEGDAQRKASIVVRHHRRNIVRYVRERLVAGARMLHTDMQKLVITLWAANVSDYEAERANAPFDVADLSETGAAHDTDDDLPADIGQVRAFLLAGTAFRWLLNCIKTTCSTTETGPERLQMHKSLLALRLNGHGSFEAEFDWNPLCFLEQQYKNVPDATIGTSIAYNGTGDLVEALGCKDYIDRLWPIHGEQVLSCVEQLVLDRTAHEPRASITLEAQNTMIELSIRHDTLHATIEGDVLASVETMEILAWLGTACRAAPESERSMLCSARLLDADSLTAARITFGFSELADMPPMNDDFTATGPKCSSLTASADCWAQLVKNPAIVKGYPVLRRHNNERGLEIDLGLMTQLAKAHRVITVDGLLMLKSFCSMFVAVAEAGGSVLWHYILGSNNCPVSYSEARKYCKLLIPVKASTLPHARHFVGMVQSATILTGTQGANYDIGFTGKNFASTGFAIKDLTLGVSKIFALSAKLVPGHKDTRLALSKPQCFELEVGYAGSTRVLFYDTEEKRGWLVDGHDAVLHLSCAYLSSSFAPPAENGLTADLVQQFRYRSVVNGRWQTSSEVLCNPDNLKIRVGHTYHLSGDVGDQDSTYKSKASSGLRFEDIVLNNLEVLREIVANQEDTRKREDDQVDVKHPLTQRQIVGFGFADIVSLEQKLRPRFADLKYSGPEWTELAHQTDAINILGCGFGDLLGTPSECKKCTGVPSKYEFLTASARILRRTEVANGISWNLPDTSSYPTSCRCTPLSHGIRCGVALTDLRACRASEKDRVVRHKGRASVALDGLFVIGRENDMRSARRAMQYASLRCSACDDCKMPEKIHELDVPRQEIALSSPRLSANDGTPLGSSTTEDSGYASGISSSTSDDVPVYTLSEIAQEPMAVPLQSALKQSPLLAGYGDASSSSTQPGVVEDTPVVHSDGSPRRPQWCDLGNANGGRTPQFHGTANVCIAARNRPNVGHANLQISGTSRASAAGLRQHCPTQHDPQSPALQQQCNHLVIPADAPLAIDPSPLQLDRRQQAPARSQIAISACGLQPLPDITSGKLQRPSYAMAAKLPRQRSTVHHPPRPMSSLSPRSSATAIRPTLSPRVNPGSSARSAHNPSQLPAHALRRREGMVTRIRNDARSDLE
ncbi:hypothetical protein LTS10_005848 [Elasticomyces elasticus]|nr:hypothetical protein LTS10_005848 [Elasticomyces elasticus]